MKRRKVVAFEKFANSNVIEIKAHAIQRYQQRVENVSWQIAEERLREIAKKGTATLVGINAKNPQETEYKIAYNGVELLATKNGDTLYVITCHGNEALQKWCRAQMFKRFNTAKMVM